MEIEEEANSANMEEDLLLTDELAKLEEDCDEHLEMSLSYELVSDFTPYAEVESDNLKVTKLSTLSATLKADLEQFKAYRTATINRFRVGSKVEPITHTGEVETLLRFFGYVHTVKEVREPSMKLLRQHDIGQIVEDYTKFLEEKALKWSSITNCKIRRPL